MNEKEINEIVKAVANEMKSESMHNQIIAETMKNIDNRNDVTQIVSATLNASMEFTTVFVAKVLARLHV